MADLKRRGRLVASPPREDAVKLIDQPPVNPLAPVKIDGRSLRKTGRTHQFGTRVKPETHQAILEIVEAEGITVAELIERMVEDYQRKRARKSGG